MEQKKDLQLQVFSEGQALELSDVNIDSLKHISENLNLNQQFDLLIGHFTSLVKTVNINAAFLRHFILKNKEKKPIEDFLHEALEKFNNCVHKLEYQNISSSSLNAARTIPNNSNQYDWGRTLNEYSEACKLIVKSILKATDKPKMEDLATKYNMLEARIAKTEAQDSERNNTITNLQHDVASLESFVDEMRGDKMETAKKTLDFITSENLHKSPVIINFHEKLRDSEQSLLDLANKVSLLNMSLNTLPAQSVQHSNNRQSEQLVGLQLLEEIDKIKDSIAQDHQNFERRILQFEDDINEKFESTVERYKVASSVPLVLPNHSEPEEPILGNILLQSDVQNMLQKQEKNFLKKFLTLENGIKDLSDLRKYEKTMQKIQIELNSKVGQDLFNAEVSSKIDRNEFFDFINKNLVSSDQMKTFNLELVRTNRDFKDKMLDSELHLKKLRKQTEVWQGESKHECNALRDILSDLSTRVAQDQNESLKTKELLKEIEKGHGEFRSKVHMLLNQRINSLATTQALRCLSCGQKDIPYPPTLCYIEGDNKHIFIKNPEETSPPDVHPANSQGQNPISPTIIEDSQSNHRSNIFYQKASVYMTRDHNKSNTKEKRLLSAVAFLKKKEPSSLKRLSAFPRTEYLTAQKVITAQQIALEHTNMLHSKTDSNVNSKETGVLFSSSLKNPLFRIA